MTGAAAHHLVTHLPASTMATLRRSGIVRTICAMLLGLIVALSVAVPSLEVGAVAHAPAVEGPHHAASCPRAHDHRVCTQTSLNLPLALAMPGLPSMREGTYRDPSVPPALHPSVLLAPGALPRAPPV